MPFGEKSYDSPRWNGFWRLVFGVVLIFTGILPLLAAIGIIAGAIWAIVDITMQIIFGSEGWPEFGSWLSMWLSRLFYWWLDILEWIFFGTRTFPWLP